MLNWEKLIIWKVLLEEIKRSQDKFMVKFFHIFPLNVANKIVGQIYSNLYPWQHVGSKTLQGCKSQPLTKAASTFFEGCQHILLKAGQQYLFS